MTTNKEFAATDNSFRTACASVAKHMTVQKDGSEVLIDMCESRTCECWKKVATKRQASKFRRGKGRVYRGILA